MYPLAYDSWGDEEKQALQKVIDSGRYTMGNEVAEFEKQFAEHYGSKYAVMANSGSSANLLMLTALRYDDRYNLEPDDEVIVPAVSWSTTFFPVHQNNFKLVFVDINRETLNLKISSVIDAITDKTKIIFVVNLLGNPAELDKLVEICNQKNIILIEDNCESLGAKLDNSYCGTWGVMGSFSFFFSHHMQTMEGGMVLTDDLKLYQMMKSIRAHGWLRDLPAENLVCNKLGDPFKDSFRFALPGYCLRPLEMSGAVGQVQLKKVGHQIDQRRKNAVEFKKSRNELIYVNNDFKHIITAFFNNNDIAKKGWLSSQYLLNSKFKKIIEKINKELFIDTLKEFNFIYQNKVHPEIFKNYTRIFNIYSELPKEQYKTPDEYQNMIIYSKSTMNNMIQFIMNILNKNKVLKTSIKSNEKIINEKPYIIP
jgi:CDP-6-deoxy-D-xylo-4-hexulose-3-dehydrase